MTSVSQKTHLVVAFLIEVHVDAEEFDQQLRFDPFLHTLVGDTTSLLQTLKHTFGIFALWRIRDRNTTFQPVLYPKILAGPSHHSAFFFFWLLKHACQPFDREL